MKATQLWFICGALVVLLLLFVGTTIATAQTGADYHISWWTVDGGGGMSQSADEQYKLSGTIGQPDVGAATGIGYAVRGGFWGSLRAAIPEFFNYLPLITTSQ
jgi:hypothetical protein